MQSEDQPAGTPETIYLEDYKAPAYEVESLELFFDLNEGCTRVEAKTSYKKIDSKEMDLFLHGEDLKLISIRMNDRPLDEGKDYGWLDGELRIKATPNQFTLQIETELVPEENTSLDGLYKSGGNYTTQCEAEGFRKITYFMDRPDVMTNYTVRMEADRTLYPVLLSNGNLIEHGDLVCGNRHFAVWHDPFPKPSYLFALVAGDLVLTEDTFKTMSGRDVFLRIYTREGDETQVAHAMQALKDSMRWDEEAYGREYDLDLFNIVAISDFNMGAMENKSLNIFNTQLVLAHPETATDQDFLNVERVIGHEYFHNWSGNRVTCRDWFQLSLKEGFTVFRENQFGQHMNDETVERIDEVKLVRSAQFPEDAGPMAHPIRPESYIEINNFYTVTVYEKGGEVIRMLSLLLGDELYRKATDLYFERHDGQAATCDDFLKAMEDASEIDLSHFKLWYSQAGTPHVKLSHSYDEDAQTLTVSLAQTIPNTPGQTNKKPMHIPVSLGLIAANGKDMDLGTGSGHLDDDLEAGITGETTTTKILHLREESQDFTFENITEKPVISALRGFSAPIKLSTDLNDADYRFIMINDSDGFNRWDASQSLGLKMLSSMMNDGAATDQDYIDALGGVMESLVPTQGASKTSEELEDQDEKPAKKKAMSKAAKAAELNSTDLPALLARILSLPEYSVLAQDMQPIDPQAMKTARDQAMKDIGTAHFHIFEALYARAKQMNDGTSSDAFIMGWRSLMNISLAYINASQPQRGHELAHEQYQDAYCMTERMGALQVLAEQKGLAYSAALEDFYERFKQHDLVVNKWFGLQACAEHKDVISDVKALMDHPDFTLKNPNRVRSLIAAFAMRNMVMFHHESGEGYALLRDVILKLNTTNPQIAARMLTPLRQWTDFKPALRDLMHKELLAIKSTPNLSPDVFEIVTKTLEAGTTDIKAA